MEFDIDRKLLESKLDLLGDVVKKKGPWMGTNSIYFQVRNNNLAIWAVNEVVGIVAKVGRIDVEKMDKVFPADKLMTIVYKSKVNKIHFKETSDGRWDIRGNGLYKLASLPEESFPKFDTKGDLIKKLKVDGFYRQMKKVLPTVSENDAKPTLKGINIDGNFVTSDGVRLSVYRTNLQRDQGYIIPLDVADVMSSLAGKDMDLEIMKMSKENGLLFKVGDVLVMSRLLHGSFPNYEALLDKLEKSEAKFLMFDRKNFSEVLDRLIGFRDENETVLFEIRSGKLTLQVGASDSAREVVESGKTSEIFDMDIYLNIDAVNDFIQVLDGSSGIVRIYEANKPVLVCEDYNNGEKYRCLIAPLVKR